jgi:hypothetical protein
MIGNHVSNSQASVESEDSSWIESSLELFGWNLIDEHATSAKTPLSSELIVEYSICND